MRSVVLLSRRHRLYGAAARWELPEVELFLFDSPSEALARVAVGRTSAFVFDTRDYPRWRHVVRKFFSMKTDADLVLIGAEEDADDLAAGPPEVAVRDLPGDAGPDEIHQVVQRLLQLRRVRERSGIVGRSRAIAEVLSLVAHAAPLDVNVLILGESGTGKELVARAIHDNSPRSGRPFISLNCGAMSEGVLESELFGHARGAFTGAVAEHDGVFKRADGGTLFLDEVAEMPLGMQTRFLRALETGEFTPVGGRSVLHSDIRLVAATHRDLADDVGRGRFRQDLYYRLRVVVIETPALRDRREDIPILAEAFLADENTRHGMHVRGLTRAAEQALLAHDWPGNVRELRNVLSSVVVLKQRGMVDAADLPAELRPGGPVPSPYLPVALDGSGRGDLDLGLVATSLLEIRQELREIKAMLAAGGRGQGGGWTVGADGRLRPAGPVVDTFAAETGYSPLQDPDQGDLQAAERSLIESALQNTGGNRRRAAERLGISERTLYRKLRLYGLS
ncbi:MAG: sigma-54-dependent Fis family transcriptional regulator [Krumholzibacteria bacterium]|nr:sigma-54-dependent Fis family transcriptional regulator [Candidatus Krumholzibacteria bacterium]